MLTLRRGHIFCNSAFL